MTNDYEKYIQKLSPKQRKILEKIITQISHLQTKELDCKKLQGFQTLYRVRIGKWRIIFEKQKKQGIILDINTRGDVY